MQVLTKPLAMEALASRIKRMIASRWYPRNTKPGCLLGSVRNAARAGRVCNVT
jgi:hypothetical protein